MISVVNELNDGLLPEELEEEIKKIIELVLKDEGVVHPPEISVLVMNNQQIQEINQDTRGINEITDVLSFPMIEYEEGKTYKDLYVNFNFGPEYFDGDALVLGDIVISIDRAEEQAKEYGHSVKRELCYLITHSTFHLLGYDHMIKEDKQKMRVAEERVLQALAITRE
ncbi:MAG: rRNA maturation RNase YbeY [Clostridium sp.]|nr:rRNA maturation RNase YbeY [Clostridium sp.]